MIETLYVIVRIAGERVALNAADVESVIEVGTITPVPLAAGHVAGLTTLRSRVLTVIDFNVALGGGPVRPLGAPTALVCPCEGHFYALLVDAVEDVVNVPADDRAPLVGRLGERWSRVASGFVGLSGDTLLVVDVAAVLRGPSATAA